ncbi:hypothetical protein [Cellvibrio sp. OA-2007]|uniref:hypothetical protein n=1 Tax=Cellvibrio sp. OA-2007 TaxID=529823 RepID=UPI0030D89D54
MAENACMIEEVIRDSVKQGGGNSRFARLSPHLAPMLAARCEKLQNVAGKCGENNQKAITLRLFSLLVCR